MLYRDQNYKELQGCQMFWGYLGGKQMLHPAPPPGLKREQMLGYCSVRMGRVINTIASETRKFTPGCLPFTLKN